MRVLDGIVSGVYASFSFSKVEMNPELLSANIVFVTEPQDVRIFSERWFLRNEVFEDSEFDPGGGYEDLTLPGVMQRQLVNFQLLLMPDRIQFTSRMGRDFKYTITAAQRFCQAVGTTAPTRFLSVGINFDFKISIDVASSVPPITRKTFLTESTHYADEVKNPLIAFGHQIYEPIENHSMMGSILPSRTVGKVLDNYVGFSANFNFHTDILNPATQGTEISYALMRWQDHSQKAEKILSALILDWKK